MNFCIIYTPVRHTERFSESIARMTNSLQMIADKVVERFKHELSDKALESLSEADFDRLAGLIRIAVSEEREGISAQLEELAQKLKADIERFELNL